MEDRGDRPPATLIGKAWSDAKRAWSKRFIRRRLIEGMLVTAPLFATLYVLWWVFRLLDSVLGRIVYPVLDRFAPWIVQPGLGIVLLLVLLFLVGWAAEWAVGGRVLAWWHSVLERIPVTRRVYGAANRIVRTVMKAESRPFKEVVLVEYPSAGRWSLGFLSARAPDVVQVHVEDAVAVFVPTTPNPTSGFIVIVPRKSTVTLPMTIDQAFTYILSAGSAHPEAQPDTDGGSVLVPGPDWRPEMPEAPVRSEAPAGASGRSPAA